ncbi:MAG TPA: S9 family peptidase, partial [Bacteroidetes bacterium]|nr:S9 family peptidase [Bacteroidota bacterium]
MNDGEHYSVNEGNDIVRYAFATGEVVDTIYSIDQEDLPRGFSSYTFNDDETALLLATDMEARYRYATFENNYVVNLQKGSVMPLTSTGKQM